MDNIQDTSSYKYWEMQFTVGYKDASDKEYKVKSIGLTVSPEDKQ